MAMTGKGGVVTLGGVMRQGDHVDWVISVWLIAARQANKSDIGSPARMRVLHLDY